MISKPILSLGALALAAVSAAKPIPAFKDVFAKRGHSFSGYGGYDSMRNFDDFYGSEDFSGVHQKLVKEKEVVCHSVQVEIVQQHLAVIREWYKKIITEQVCEVEVQTIVHEQFVQGCDNFCGDLRRSDGCRDVSYDHDIASRIVHIHDSSSECVTNDLGFHGYDIGSHAVSYSGDNWSHDYSPETVSTSWGYAKQSSGYSSPDYVSSWQSYSPPSYSYDNSYEAPTESSDSSSSYGSSYVPSSSYGSSYSSPDVSSSSSYGSSYGSPEVSSSSSYGSSYGSPEVSSSSGYGSSYGSPEVSSSSSYGSSYGSPDVSSSSSYGSPDVSSSGSPDVSSSGPSSPDVSSSGPSSPDVSSIDSSSPAISTDASAAAPTDAASAAPAAASAAAPAASNVVTGGDSTPTSAAASASATA